jgi:hypothetical protein
VHEHENTRTRSVAEFILSAPLSISGWTVSYGDVGPSPFSIPKPAYLFRSEITMGITAESFYSTKLTEL